MILYPDKDFVYHGTDKNIQVLGMNNNINVSYVTPNRNYASRYGGLMKLTPTRPLKILVLSKKVLEEMLPMVPNTRIGNAMIKAMKAKHYKAKEGYDENTVNRLINTEIKKTMETATYRNLLKSKPIKITNNGYTRKSDEMLDLAIYSMLTRIAKKMGYDGIKTVTTGTVKNSNNINKMPKQEIVFPGRAPLRVVSRDRNKPQPSSPGPKEVYIKRIQNAGPKQFASKLKYKGFLRTKFLTTFGLPANTNILNYIETKLV